MTDTDIVIPADHPAFAGHFPGTPIVPGVVLLDLVLQAIEAGCGRPSPRCALTTVKFRSIVRPGERLRLHVELMASGAARFELESDGRAVASGTLAVPAGAANGS